MTKHFYEDINRLAQAEGWALFSYDGTGLMQIQRLDDADVFPSDEAALAHVKCLMIAGSEMHRLAMNYHRRDEEAIKARKHPREEECSPGVTRKEATSEGVHLVLSSGLDDNGRSGWYWFRLTNGDLVLGVYPHGGTYEIVSKEAP